MGETLLSTVRPTLLLVDDDAQTADLYEEFLSDDYRVLTAESADEALAIVDASVDVVLLDRRMPRGSGDDVLLEIRDRDVGCRVVMVTGVKPERDVLDLPFDDYLVKPVTRDEIRDAVSRMLERNSYDDVIESVVDLASKMATLEAKLSIQELQESDEYTTLEAELDELRGGPGVVNQANNTYASFTTEKIDALLS